MKGKLQKVMVLVMLISIIIGNVSTASAADPYLTGGKFNKSNLTYYIDTTPSSSDVPAVFDSVNLYNAIENAFSMWNTIMSSYSINLSFTSTTSRSNADIIVVMGTTGGPYGRVTHEPANSSIYTKSIMTINDYLIYLHWTGGVLSGSKIFHIMMHEIGHTIGLADISDEVADANNITSVMTNIFSVYFHNSPTSFDRTNIKKMY